MAFSHLGGECHSWSTRYRRKLQHADLAGNMWQNSDDGHYGYDAVDDDWDPADANGHGTHVAGIVGAVGNNGIGISGVAWRVKIMALRHLDSSGNGTTPRLLDCLNYAIQNGAEIINCSFRSENSQAVLDAIRTARNHQIIFVCAAGNSLGHEDNDRNDNDQVYPASYDLDNIVSVLSTDRNGNIPQYSHYGLVRVDVGAPGGATSPSTNAVYSTKTSTYAWSAGTSMAAPHVTGTLALLKAQFPRDSYIQLINRLLRSVDPLTGDAARSQTGGKINVFKAVSSFSSGPGNDNFENAYPIKIPEYVGTPIETTITATGNNIGATTESGEPNHAGNSGGKSVWWKFLPNPEDDGGFFTLSTKGSTMDTTLAVYLGSSLNALSLVGSSYTSDGCSWASVYFQAGDTPLMVAVGGYNGEIGTIKLTLHTNTASSPVWLKFDASTIQRTSGQFQVGLQGTPNMSFYVHKSTDLKNWSSHGPYTTSSGGTYTWTDSSASSLAGFYRGLTATSVQTCNAVGFLDHTFAGNHSHLIPNPFNCANNTVSSLFPAPASGTQILKWNHSTAQWSTNTFNGSVWSDPNMELVRGEGLMFASSANYTKTFVGEISQGFLLNPIPSGLSLRSSLMPIAAGLKTGLGFPALDGDNIVMLISNSYWSYTYFNGKWFNSSGVVIPEPQVQPYEAFWVNRPGNWKQIPP